MKKGIKIGVISIILLIVSSIILEWILESKFERFVNANPDRDYDISYEEFDFSSFFTDITLDNVSITPLNKTKGTIINGTVDYAELTGFAWTRYLFDKNMKVDAIRFFSPEFHINFVEDTLKKEKKKNKNSIQTLFSDIISRADLNDFEIKNGSVVITQGDSLVKGKVHKINIEASEIETDSVQLNYIIPFKLGDLEVEIDSMFYKLNTYSKAKLGAINYSIADESMEINDLSLDNDKNWVAISEDRGIQDDVMEFDLKSIKISGVDFSKNFWTNLDINASKMEIDSLNLSMRRNKNLKRPKNVKKEMFMGLVDKIPYNIDLDSINIRHSKILYGELSPHRQHTGEITLNDINGSITKFTTFPERQKEFEEFNARFTVRLNDAADMTIDLDVPYDKDTFRLHTTLTDLDMTALTPSLKPLLGIEILDGYLKRLNYKMNASFYGSRNNLIMDYENLELLVYEEYDDGTLHKRGFMSTIANAAVRQHNLPEDRRYETASYATKRNIYSSPVQHIVEGLLDGVKQIVPARGIQAIFGNRRRKRD